MKDSSITFFACTSVPLLRIFDNLKWSLNNSTFVNGHIQITSCLNDAIFYLVDWCFDDFEAWKLVFPFCIVKCQSLWNANLIKPQIFQFWSIWQEIQAVHYDFPFERPSSHIKSLYTWKFVFNIIIIIMEIKS